MTIRKYTTTFLCLIMVVFLSRPVKAQTSIRGTIYDFKNKIIPNVTVTYREKTESPLSGFTRSNESGRFEITVDSKNDQIILTLSHLAYVKVDTTLRNSSGEYVFKLIQKAQHLNEVKVKLPPISKNKDTLNFLADSFTSKQDRSIAEVIAKLPGIEMNGDKILYQGKPIQKYMINNLDLMEGKYGLVNNNLPAAAVKKIQIIENNQPIKILDSLLVSDRASLNLELKKYTTTGSGKVGLGLNPALWDGNLTPMTFNKSFQSVTSLQSNNIGNDVSKELNDLSFASDGFGLINTSAAVVPLGQSFLDIQSALVPQFDENRWLDNHIVLSSSNVLIKFNNDIQIKANLSYYNDQQRRQGSTITQMFVPGEVVQISELINNRYSINNLRTGFVVEKNVKKIFYKNDFQLRKRWNDDNGHITFNRSEIIKQQKLYQDLGLTNKLSLAKYLGKQLISFNSSIIYNTTPQSLTIFPGQFQDLFNDNESFNSLKQNIDLKSLKVDNYVTFSRTHGQFVITPKIGLNIENSDLKSNIIVDNNSRQELSSDFRNIQRNRHIMTFFHPSVQFKIERFNFTLTLPYTLNSFNVDQLGKAVINKYNVSTFNPNFSAQFLLSKKHQLLMSGSSTTQFGDLLSSYSSFIVTSYRDISRYNSKIRQTDFKNGSIQYKYADTYSGTFVNATYHFDHRRNDFIFRNNISNSGLRTITVEDANSSNYTQGISGSISKLFANINTVAKAKVGYDLGEADYLINDEVGRIKSITYTSGAEVNNNSLEYLTFQYKVFWNKTSGKMSDRNIYHYNTVRQDLNTSVFPLPNQSLNIKTAYFFTQSLVEQKQLFIDLMYRWSFIKSKIELEITGINVLNNDSYIQRTNNSYALTESYYLLRPRQVLASVRFRF